MNKRDVRTQVLIAINAKTVFHNIQCHLLKMME